MKSEPAAFSFDALKAKAGRTEHWDGVRNYQARNFVREMRVGDLVLFYHSNCEQPAAVGIAEVARDPYPDFTAWDRSSEHFDPASTPEFPRWFMVDVRWKQAFDEPVTLSDMKSMPELKAMRLLKRGNRLSVMPVTNEQFDAIAARGMKRRLPE
ncbi:MAG TPA: EVE domain-containing protein [Dissulfurispiraceae bacterium]|nr:EVE domain-containing protein [Dissulfurispiraceae bacterium]